MSLVKAAIAQKATDLREARRGRGDAYDQYWCVFDFDIHPRVYETIRCAEQNGIEVAISNPCIELWFVLHFYDHFAFIDSDDVQRRCRELLGCEKVLTPDALAALEARHEEAVKRAQALDVKHLGDGSPPLSNPSSSLWRLVEAIRTSV
jgi:hypothetical protein